MAARRRARQQRRHHQRVYEPWVGERITNAAYALIELAYEMSPAEVDSPAVAAAHYFGVPLGGVGGMSEADRRSPGQKIRISLDDSGSHIWLVLPRHAGFSGRVS